MKKSYTPDEIFRAFKSINENLDMPVTLNITQLTNVLKNQVGCPYSINTISLYVKANMIKRVSRNNYVISKVTLEQCRFFAKELHKYRSRYYNQDTGEYIRKTVEPSATTNNNLLDSFKDLTLTQIQSLCKELGIKIIIQ